jgi:hypothetical protein
MEGNARTWFTPKQKAELWERWRSGQCVADIARCSEYARITPNSGHSAAARADRILAALYESTLWSYFSTRVQPAGISLSCGRKRPL